MSTTTTTQPTPPANAERRTVTMSNADAMASRMTQTGNLLAIFGPGGLSVARLTQRKQADDAPALYISSDDWSEQLPLGRHLAAGWNAALDAELTTEALEAGVVRTAICWLRRIESELNDYGRVSCKTEAKLPAFIDKLDALLARHAITAEGATT